MSKTKTITTPADLGLDPREAELFVKGAQKLFGVPGKMDEEEQEPEKKPTGKIGKVDLGYQRPLNKPLAR